MEKVLVLNASVTGVTKKLFDLRVKEGNHTDWEITTLDLNKEFKTLLNSESIGDFFKDGTKYIDMMQQYDKVVLVGSMVNGTFNSTMKTLIDKITLPRVTFAYTPDGKMYSPMQGKWKPKFTIVFSSGSARSNYSANVNNTVETFIDILKMNGIDKTDYYWIDGTNMPNVIQLSVEQKYEALKSKFAKPIKY